MKAVMSNKYFSFEYDCLNEDHGLFLCELAYKKMGLIGRYYITSGSLKTWINNG